MRHSRRAFGQLIGGSLPWTAAWLDQGGRRTIPRIALGAPAQETSVDAYLSLAADVGFRAVELEARQLEALLGAPSVPPATAAPPGHGLDQGLLDLEEDILRESADLERTARLGRLRDWRRGISLAPIHGLRGELGRSRISVVGIRWDGLAQLSDEELDYAARLTTAIGAPVITTTFSLTGAERLGGKVSGHHLRVGLLVPSDATEALARRALSSHGSIDLVVDLASWASSGQQSPLPFLRAHATRVTQVVLRDWRRADGAIVPLGRGDGRVESVLRWMRAERRAFPAMVPMPTAAEHPREALTQALAFCEGVLSS